MYVKSEGKILFTYAIIIWQNIFPLKPAVLKEKKAKPSITLYALLLLNIKYACYIKTSHSPGSKFLNEFVTNIDLYIRYSLINGK